MKEELVNADTPNLGGDFGNSSRHRRKKRRRRLDVNPLLLVCSVGARTHGRRRRGSAGGGAAAGRAPCGGAGHAGGRSDAGEDRGDAAAAGRLRAGAAGAERACRAVAAAVPRRGARHRPGAPAPPRRVLPRRGRGRGRGGHARLPRCRWALQSPRRQPPVRHTAALHSPKCPRPALLTPAPRVEHGPSTYPPTHRTHHHSRSYSPQKNLDVFFTDDLKSTELSSVPKDVVTRTLL